MNILTLFIYNNFWERRLYFSPCCWSGMLLMISESPVKRRCKSQHWNLWKLIGLYFFIIFSKYYLTATTKNKYNQPLRWMWNGQGTKWLCQILLFQKTSVSNYWAYGVTFTYRGQWWPACTPCSIYRRLCQAQCCFHCSGGHRSLPAWHSTRFLISCKRKQLISKLTLKLETLGARLSTDTHFTHVQQQ